MTTENTEKNDIANQESGQATQGDYRGYPDRRSGKDRRSGSARRKGQEPADGPERRSGEDRREGERRKRIIRIPFFIKLATLTTMLIFFILTTLSFSILEQQKRQFMNQLVDLGEIMARIVANNARDKLLGEEELPLFQLLDDVAQNEQVIYALIVDDKDIIKAHSNMKEVNKPFSRPRNARFIRAGKDVITRTIMHDGEEVLFFETAIVYQKLKVGRVRLAISMKKVLENINKGKRFIWVLTGITTLMGILLSLGLSKYFSSPIKRLGEGTKALGMGNFDHRVSIKRNDELGDLAYGFNRMAEDLELKEKIKDSFGRYVTPEIVEKILANPDMQWMKGAKVEGTVLFVDIRGFTTISEKKDPEGVVELLNDYFTRVTDAVIEQEGHINKFVGDEAMVVFGSPIPNPMHAVAAVRSALDIQERISQRNQEKGLIGEKLYIGIGINSGEMVAGNLGSQRKMEYTVIGDNVNIASRLTSLAKAGEILISGNTYDLIQGQWKLKVEERGKVPVKGRKEVVGIYNVLGMEEEQIGEDEQNEMV